MLGYVDLLTYFGKEQCNICVWVKGGASCVVLDDGLRGKNNLVEINYDTGGWFATKCILN